MLVLRHFISLYTLLFFLLFSCDFSEDKADKKNVQDAPNDEHSYSNIDRVSVLIDKLFISKNKKIDYNVIASLFKTHPRNIKNLKTKQYIK